MAIQWILTAERGGAKLFRSAPSGNALHLIKDLPHPSGRLADGAIVSDKAGRLFSPANQGRSATDSENTPHDHEAEVFAHHLAEILEQGRNQNEYDQLVLIAEPRFLGRLKAALSQPTASKVVRIIEKDLAHLTAHELEQRLTVLIAA
jgi:protein required for attachment to host cells